MIPSLSTSAALLVASLLPLAPDAQKAMPAGLTLDGAPSRLVEARASTFAKSTQDAAALAVSPRGDAVVVWQSRRQEAHNYGVYAQRFGPRGERLGVETRVHERAEGPQNVPAVALDAAGAAWFAWESYGQDGDAGTVVARRFDAALSTGTREVIVDDDGAGTQAEAALACDARGVAWIAWTAPGGAQPDRRVVRARRFGADGEPLGPVFVVAEGGAGIARNPCIALDARGGAAIAWARADAQGRPDGIRARRYDADGRAIGGEEALSPELAFVGERAIEVENAPMPIEPVVAFAGDELVAAWLEAAGADYVPVLARFSWRADALEWERGVSARFPGAGEGYTSALDLALAADGRALVAWNRHEGGVADVVGRVVERDGTAGPLERLTAARDGEQRLQVGPGARRLAWRADGAVEVAWSGDAGLGDASAANLSLHLPAKLALDAVDSAAPLAAAKGPEGAHAAEQAGAAPHDPPIEDPFGAVRREDFALDQALSLSGPDFGFVGIVQTNLTPPDPHIAVGPEHVVEVVNAVVGFFEKDGTFLSQQAMSGAGGFWVPAGAPANAFVFDPEVVFDLASQRFFVMANERSGGQSFFDLAVSDDANPVGTWFKYRFQTPGALGDIDSPNLAVADDVVTLGADFFFPDRYFVLSVEKAPLLSGAAPQTAGLTITGTQSHGLPTGYGATPTQYLVESLEAPTNTTIRIHAVQSPLASPTLATFTLGVPSYSQPEDPPQLGTSVRPETFESRFWSCLYRDGNLWATHHQGSTRVLQRWYQIATNGWPTSGQNPTLVQTGTIDPGATVRTFFGSIGVDALGNVGLVFARSSPTEFISMSRVYRLAGDPAGTTTPAVVMQASTVPDTTTRWGDYSGCSPDPIHPGVFWGGHEFRNNSGWGTWIGTFGPCDAPTTYCTAKTTSQGLVPAIAGAGQPSLGSNAFSIEMTNGIPNATVLYFHGSAAASTPWFNGTLCVTPPLVRGPVTSFDPFGAVSSSIPIDVSMVGTERYYQYWFRDVAQTDGTGVGMSDGLKVPFCP